MKRASKVAEKPSVHFADTTPKIGIAAVDLASAPDLSWLSGARLVAMSVQDGLLQLIEGGTALPLVSVPVQMLGFLVLSDSGGEEVARVRSEWQDSFRCEPPPVLDARAGVDPIVVLSWQSERLIALQREAARRNVRLMRDLAAVRAAHDETQEAFRRLEAFAAANLSLLQQEALTLEPMRHGVRFSSDTTGLIEQRMPLSSVGVSDVAIHVNSLTAGARGELKVCLRTIEDDQTVGTWTIPTSRLQSGWLRLSLREALGVDEQSIVMLVDWEGEGQLVLSLSNRHPDERWCARRAGRSVERVLAMRAWRGVPGTRANRVPNAVLVDDAPIASRWIVDEETLRAVELVNGPANHVSFVEEKRAVLVHPADQTPTVARLPGGCPAGARHIWAQVETTHPEAATVEYALAMALAPEAGAPGSKQPLSAGHISEWFAVEPGKKADIHLFLPEPTQMPADLYLATRMPPGASNAHCQAHFSLIRAKA